MTRILKIFITGMLAMAAKLSAPLTRQRRTFPARGTECPNPYLPPLEGEVASSAVGWCPACEAKTT